MRTKSSKKNKINVVTLGCSKNLYDSEILISQLKANNKNVVHEEDGNIIVIKLAILLHNAAAFPSHKISVNITDLSILLDIIK